MLHDKSEQTTLVTFLLDRTGSMQAIKADTIGGFNAYLDTLEREVGDLVEFSLLQSTRQTEAFESSRGRHFKTAALPLC
jgi:hypothetical protein